MGLDLWWFSLVLSSFPGDNSTPSQPQPVSSAPPTPDSRPSSVWPPHRLPCASPLHTPFPADPLSPTFQEKSPINPGHPLTQSYVADLLGMDTFRSHVPPWFRAPCSAHNPFSFTQCTPDTMLNAGEDRSHEPGTMASS